MAKTEVTTSVTINGAVYVPQSEVSKKSVDLDGMRFVIVRTYSAGVYFGWLKEEEKDEVILVNARNAWYWSGASSLMQMANDGVKNKSDCKFTQVVEQIKLKGVIAILDCTKVAQDNLTSVNTWES